MVGSKIAIAALLLVPCAAWAASQGAATAPQRAFAEVSTRGNARIFYWGGNSSGGQISVDYGQPTWKESYDESASKLLGVRWRLGQNAWTRLDSNMEFTLAGQSFEAGEYYVALERRKEDQQFVLWLLDPVEIRDRRLDAFQVTQTTGGTPVPLQYELSPIRADKLSIRLDVDPNVRDGGALVIHFGKHQLKAALTLQPDRG